MPFLDSGDTFCGDICTHKATHIVKEGNLSQRTGEISNQARWYDAEMFHACLIIDAR